MLNCYEESLLKNSTLPSEWQSQSSLDEFFSFLQSNWDQRYVLFEDNKLSKKQQFIEFLGSKSIKTQNYVGTIVFKNHQLNIFPKVFRSEKDDNDISDLKMDHLMKNLVQWISYCNRMNYPFININADLDDAANLKELFVSLYVRSVQNTLDRGLFYRYEEHTEDVRSIKGKFDIKDYIIRKYPNGKMDTFKCTFSEFEYDNVLNRIIKFTCKSLLSETSVKNQKIIRNILIKLSDVSDVRCTPQDCDTIRLNYLQRHYQTILTLSKIFLLNKTSSYNLDNNESFCFLFPTEYLFEGFIGGFLQETLQGKAKVRLQASEVSLINDVVIGGKSFGSAFKMRHDILVEHKEKGLFILDTKYKQLERIQKTIEYKNYLSATVDQDDLYQVIEYAAHRELTDVYLLYPMYRYESEENEDTFLVRETVSGKQKISVHIIRLPFIFEDDIEITKRLLAKEILKIF